jgi:hypothetical protein
LQTPFLPISFAPAESIYPLMRAEFLTVANSFSNMSKASWLQVRNAIPHGLGCGGVPEDLDAMDRERPMTA